MDFTARNVKDRVVQNPARYQLVEVSAGVFDFIPQPGTITEVGTEINKAYLQPIEDAVGDFTYRGYGNAAAELADKNLNNLKINGTYMGSNLTNAPTTEWYMVEVIRHNDIWVYQRAIAFTYAGYSPTYERTLKNGVWGVWVLVVSRSEVDLTSDIPNTIQVPTIVGDLITQIAHTKLVGGSWITIRTDTFTYTAGLITEVRVLAAGGSRTFYYDLDNLQTEVY